MAQDARVEFAKKLIADDPNLSDEDLAASLKHWDSTQIPQGWTVGGVKTAVKHAGSEVADTLKTFWEQPEASHQGFNEAAFGAEKKIAKRVATNVLGVGKQVLTPPGDTAAELTRQLQIMPYLPNKEKAKAGFQAVTGIDPSGSPQDIAADFATGVGMMKGLGGGKSVLWGGPKKPPSPPSGPRALLPAVTDTAIETSARVNTQEMADRAAGLMSAAKNPPKPIPGSRLVPGGQPANRPGVVPQILEELKKAGAPTPEPTTQLAPPPFSNGEPAAPTQPRVNVLRSAGKGKSAGAKRSTPAATGPEPEGNVAARAENEVEAGLAGRTEAPGTEPSYQGHERRAQERAPNPELDRLMNETRARMAAELPTGEGATPVPTGPEIAPPANPLSDQAILDNIGQGRKKGEVIRVGYDKPTGEPPQGASPEGGGVVPSKIGEVPASPGAVQTHPLVESWQKNGQIDVRSRGEIAQNPLSKDKAVPRGTRGTIEDYDSLNGTLMVDFGEKYGTVMVNPNELTAGGGRPANVLKGKPVTKAPSPEVQARLEAGETPEAIIQDLSKTKNAREVAADFGGKYKPQEIRDMRGTGEGIGGMGVKAAEAIKAKLGQKIADGTATPAEKTLWERAKDEHGAVDLKKLIMLGGGVAGGVAGASLTDDDDSLGTAAAKIGGGIAGGAALPWVMVGPGRVGRALTARTESFLSGTAPLKNVLTAVGAPVSAAMGDSTQLSKGRMAPIKEALRLPTNTRNFVEALKHPAQFNKFGRTAGPFSKLIGAIDTTGDKLLERGGVSELQRQRQLLTGDASLFGGINSKPPKNATPSMLKDFEEAQSALDAAYPFQRVPAYIFKETARRAGKMVGGEYTNANGVRSVTAKPWKKGAMLRPDMETAMDIASVGGGYALGEWAKGDPRKLYAAKIAMALLGPRAGLGTLGMAGNVGGQAAGGISPIPEQRFDWQGQIGFPPSMWKMFQKLGGGGS